VAVEQKRKTVLVVEDDPDLRQLILDFLDFDYAAVGAATAEAGVEAAHRFHPDLIVCDHHLPGRSGLHLAQEVRRDPSLTEVPIVVMSAQRQPEALESFGVFIVPKPCHMNRLMDAVHVAFGAGPD
jgi:CheY-like chemotaxis protein